VLHGAAVEQLRQVVEERVDPERTELACRQAPGAGRKVYGRTHVFDEEDGLPADLRAEILCGELGCGFGQPSILEESVVLERLAVADERELLARRVEL
jgi:hypothetical protein